MVRQFLSIFLAFLLTLFQFPAPALADTLDSGWSASVPTTTTQGIPMPDWSRITFASLPPVQSGGSISIPTNVAARADGYNPSRSWKPGTPLADLLTLGDLQQDFSLEKLTLEAIAQRTGMDLSQVSLASFGLMKEQTISSLVAAIPDLGNYPLEQVKPLAEVVEAATGQRVSWQSQSMAPFAVLPLVIAATTAPSSGQSLNAVASDPNLGQQSLSSANLNQHSVNDIPGLSQTSLGEFDGWQQQAISTVPGLANVSFNSTPNSIADFLGFVGTDDVTYGDSGDVEHTSTETTHSITGSDKVGFNYQCDQGRSCAYLELASPSFLGNFGSPILHGAQWIKGGTDPGGQMVDGGHGVLGAVNGGKEPTGRLPFGPSVKVVLTGDNESDGSGTFGLYFRVCHSFLGCTPYFIGPVPFYSVHEKGVVIVGLTEMEKPSWIQQPDTPSDVQNIIDANDPGDSSNDGSIQMDKSCLSGLVGSAKAGDQESATTRIPAILQAAQKAGITDRAQLAYLLATSETETDFTPRDEGNDNFKRSGRAGAYYGRGDVQLTWKSNYQYWSNRLGVDLVNNPELANRSDISAEILAYGEKDGTFTGKKLSNYIDSANGRADFTGARHIVNDSDKNGQTAAYAQQFYTALKGCSTLATTSGGTGSDNSGGPTTTGSYPGKVISSADGNATEQSIVQAINGHYGASSANDPGTKGGKDACAYEVNQVLQQSIHHKIGSAPASVPSVESALRSGAGTQVTPAQAHAGDIAVFQGSGGEHIGFCMDDGCTKVISNSSSKATFTWVSSRSFYDSYYQSNSSQHIYRANG